MARADRFERVPSLDDRNPSVENETAPRSQSIQGLLKNGDRQALAETTASVPVSAL